MTIYDEITTVPSNCFAEIGPRDRIEEPKPLTMACWHRGQWWSWLTKDDAEVWRRVSIPVFDKQKNRVAITRRYRPMGGSDCNEMTEGYRAELAKCLCDLRSLCVASGK